jgi:riboflavin biosynthesis pyrimidine reductase
MIEGNYCRTSPGDPAVPAAGGRGQAAADGRHRPARYRRISRLILATRGGWGGERLDPFRRLGWEVWELPADRPASRPRGATARGRGAGSRRGEERVSLAHLARRAGREGLLHLLVEAGPALAGGLLDAGLVDELSLYQAPIVLGGTRGWPEGWSAPDLRRAVRFDPVARKELGGDRWQLLRRESLLERVRCRVHGVD